MKFQRAFFICLLHKPDSVVFQLAIIYLTAAYPLRFPLQESARLASTRSVHDIATCKVCPACKSPYRHVRSYRTIAPLPLTGRYSFCDTFCIPLPEPHELSGTAPCVVRTFLSRSESDSFANKVFSIKLKHF